MKNVTISLPDSVAVWARIKAAKADKSMSRFIADLMIERQRLDDDRSERLKRIEAALAGPGYPGAAAQWPARDEIHDR